MELFIAGVTLGLMAMGLFARMYRPPEPPVVIVQWPESESQPRRGCLSPFILVGLALLLVFAVYQWSKPEQAQVPLGATMVPVPSQEEGLHGKAVPVTPTSVPRWEDANAKNRMGLDLLAQGDYLAAEAWFQAAISADPAFYESYNNLAFCLYERGEAAQALVLWQTALQLDSSSPDAHAGLATALWMLGQQPEAQQSYQRAVALESRYDDVGWMAQERHWSAKILNDSQPLRGWLAAGGE